MISKSLQFRSKKECACDSVSCGIWKHLSMTTYAVSERETVQEIGPEKPEGKRSIQCRALF